MQYGYQTTGLPEHPMLILTHIISIKTVSNSKAKGILLSLGDIFIKLKWGMQKNLTIG